MKRQLKISEISTQAIKDMRGKSLAEMYQLIKPETDEATNFYNSIIHNVISATQKELSTEDLTISYGGLN